MNNNNSPSSDSPSPTTTSAIYNTALNTPTTTTLNILNHNVQGLNQALKLQLLLEHCNSNEIDIAFFIETKLAASSNNPIALTNPLYKIYTANCDQANANIRESSKGVAIALKPTLQPYIH